MNLYALMTACVEKGQDSGHAEDKLIIHSTHCLLDRPAPNPITNTGKLQQEVNNLETNNDKTDSVQRSHYGSLFLA